MIRFQTVHDGDNSANTSKGNLQYQTDIYEKPKWHYIYKSIRDISYSIGYIHKSIRSILNK